LEILYYEELEKMPEKTKPSTTLRKTLSPLLLWGLGVGYVISGMYFGWNLGLEKGGVMGMAAATFIVIIMYVCFSFSYTEMACAIPKAGGGFDYVNRAFGKNLAFLAGLAQIIEFVFAPPAIAIAIGTYLNLSFPEIPVLYAAFVAYFIFTALNIYGIKAAATFELLITLLAVFELLLFAGITLPHFSKEAFIQKPFVNGWSGAFAALPFAIWFFLGIEGVANVAEETKNPQKDILKGFGSAILTLAILCVLVFFSAIGVGGWEQIVYNPDGSISDSPLPLAMGKIVSTSSWLYHMLISIGIFGLVASFHGLILASGRATMEFGKLNFAPAFLGKINKRFQTPATALIANMLVGLAAIMTGKTGEIITIAVFGALCLYVISMLAFFQLRKKEPELHRPFKVPFYPIMPGLALIISFICLIALVYFNVTLALFYFGFLLLSFGLFKQFYKADTSN
jgi:ethanolamine permease